MLDAQTTKIFELFPGEVAPCTALVEKVLTHVRSLPNSSRSVETDSQLEFLVEYQGLLIKKLLNPSIACIDTEEKKYQPPFL